MAKVSNRNEKRSAFVELRANGATIKAAAEHVGISERLGKLWAHELEGDVAVLTQSKQTAIYDKYGLRRSQRIERLAKVTDKLLQAVEHINIERLVEEKPDKALELVLKFIDAIEREEPKHVNAELQTAQGALVAIEALYRRVTSGEASRTQAETELRVILAALSGIDATKTSEKLEALEHALNEAEEAKANLTN